MRLTHSITFTYASTLNNLINSLLFMDLFLTIRNPFYQRSKRIPLYCIFIFIVEAILTGLIIMTINDVDIVYGRIPEQMEAMEKLTLTTNFYLMIFPIVSTMLVVYRLMTNGTSKDLKQKICKRHLMYFVFFFIGVVAQQLPGTHLRPTYYTNKG